MAHKRPEKPRPAWQVLLTMLLALFTGCAQFPEADSREWCQENVGEAKLQVCFDEVDRRAGIARVREEKKREKAECLWPHGVWIEPPGHCAKNRSF